MATAEKNSYFSRKVVFLNVMATFLIVLIHSETPLRFGKELTFDSYPFIFCVLQLAAVAVPLFYFISALLFYRDCDWRELPHKLYRRIFTLLIPYLIWNLFFILVYYILRQIPFTASRMNMPHSLDSAKDWLLALWHCRFTPLWFIKYLIFFNLLSPVILLLIKNKWVGLVAVVSFTLAGYILGWSSVSLRYNAAIYLAGAMAGRYLYPSGKNENGPLVRKNQILLLVPMVLMFIVLFITGMKSYGALYLFKIAGPIIVWFTADLAVPESIGKKWKVKPWMGYTFFIYATHQFLLNVEQSLVRSFLPGTPLVLNLTFIITPVITIFVLIFVAGLLSKTKLYGILTGGR
ncbi:MAG: acyltransferase [Bacteroidales bacterium]|nr:acyltransferase [Bacteroidales bacterium]